MRKMVRCGSLMLTLVVGVTTAATGQVGGVGGAAPGAPPQAGQPGEVTGKVSSVGGSTKTVTVQVEYQAYEANKAARPNTNNSRLNQLYRLQMEIQRSRSPQERMRRMMEMQRDMARLQMEMARLGATPQQAPFKVVTKKQDHEITTDDTTKVRFLQPPVAFDEKGNPRKYTDAELKELKGPDTKLPGYQGTFDMLRPGHVVRIAIGKKTAGKAAAKDIKDLDKVPGAPDDDDKPFATLILVTGEDVPPPKKK